MADQTRMLAAGMKIDDSARGARDARGTPRGPPPSSSPLPRGCSPEGHRRLWGAVTDAVVVSPLPWLVPGTHPLLITPLATRIVKVTKVMARNAIVTRRIIRSVSSTKFL